MSVKQIAERKWCEYGKNGFGHGKIRGMRQKDCGGRAGASS